jgi:hypothetical protein
MCVCVASATSTLNTNYEPDTSCVSFTFFRSNQSIEFMTLFAQKFTIAIATRSPCSFTDVAHSYICAQSRSVNIIMWFNLKPLTLVDMRSEGQVSHSIQVLLYIYIADNITKEGIVCLGERGRQHLQGRRMGRFFLCEWKIVNAGHFVDWTPGQGLVIFTLVW